MTGFWIFFKVFGMAILFVVVPLFTIFFGIIITSMYVNHKMGRLHSWKNITSRKVSSNIIWADDFREACELFYENPNDTRVQGVLKNVMMESMLLINDGDINPNRCEITGVPSWLLKEQLKVNLHGEYYVKNWGDMPTKVEK